MLGMSRASCPVGPPLGAANGRGLLCRYYGRVAISERRKNREESACGTVGSGVGDRTRYLLLTFLAGEPSSETPAIPVLSLQKKPRHSNARSLRSTDYSFRPAVLYLLLFLSSSVSVSVSILSFVPSFLPLPPSSPSPKSA